MSADHRDPAEEVVLLLERFGPGTSIVFDGPAARCPVCRGEIEQLALILDLAGLQPVGCRSCGAVLAA